MASLSLDVARPDSRLRCEACQTAAKSCLARTRIDSAKQRRPYARERLLSLFSYPRREWALALTEALEALLLEEERQMPEEGWTKTALEDMADVGSGGIDEVLAGVRQLKLIEHHNGRWLRPAEHPPVAAPLLALVEASRNLPDDAIEPIPRRPYRRRS